MFDGSTPSKSWLIQQTPQLYLPIIIKQAGTNIYQLWWLKQKL